MNFRINEQAAVALDKRKKHQIYLLLVSIAAVFTVIGVVFALTRPGRAFSSLEKTLECQVEVHEHTADCYDADGNLICGYADYVCHIHDPELCYDENGELICQLPEIIPHEHDENCYLERMVLVCGCEEGQVVDANGNPVFDADGNPIFDIADVPETPNITVDGELDSIDEEIGEEIGEDAEIVDGEEADAEDAEAEDGEEADAEDTEAEDAEGVDAEDADAEKKDDTKTEDKTDKTDKTDSKTDDKTDSKTEDKTDSKTDDKTDSKTDDKTDSKTEDKTDSKTEDKTDSKTDDKTDSKTDDKTDKTDKTDSKTDDKTDKTDKTDSKTDDKTDKADSKTDDAADTKADDTKADVKEDTASEETKADDTSTAEETKADDTTAAEETKADDTTASDDTTTADDTAATDDAADTTTDTTASDDAVTDNTEAEAAGSEAEGEGEIITETVDLSANAGEDAEEEYSYHVHTAECYKIEKELICTIPTLHIHTADCYDADGNLTCDQLQLTMHVHSDECFHYEEKTVTKTAVAGDYTVTATYGASAKIPSKAELVVTIIDNGEATSEAAQTALAASGDEESEIMVGFDISFMYNGEEIQPEGPVNITVTFNNEELGDEDPVDVIHVKDDGSTESFGGATGADGEISFDATSFSPYFLLTKKGNIEAKKYTNTTLGFSSVKNGFDDPYFSKYKISNGIFGDIASNFHIIAFNDATLSSHVNGNILVRNLISAQDFGTNTKTINGVTYSVTELSYIQNLGSFTGRLDQGIQNQDDHATVLGSNTKVSLSGSDVCINDKRLDNNTSMYTIIETDTSNAPFIDINALKTSIENLSTGLKNTGENNPNINIYKNFSDQNNRYILLTDPDVAGYINMTAADLNGISGNPLRLIGFQKNPDGTVRNGSIIINVNCSGVSEVKMPTEAKVYTGTSYQKNGANYSISDYGTAANIEETVDFSAGKVIWNFYNCNGVTITGQQFTGCVIAPGATLKVSNANGNFIAYNIEVSGETHRTDFRGTSIPFKTSFSGVKTVKGQVPAEDEVFTFALSEYAGGGKWNVIDTAKNTGSTISFGKITYNNESQLGVHWYKINEVEGSGDTDGRQFGYDDTEYLIRVEVIKDGNEYKASTTYYKYSDGNKISIVDGNVIANEGFKMTGSTSTDFDNTPPKTSVSVEKRWVDYKNENLVSDLPEKLTVYLYSTTDKNIDVNSFSAGSTINGVTLIETVDLNADNGWSHEWKELDRVTKENKDIYYFVKEEELVGFTPSASYETWFQKGTQSFVNKKPFDFTSLEVDKKFVAYSFTGKELLEVTNPITGGVKPEDAKVSFKLQRKVFENGEEKATEYYNGKAFRDGQEVTFENGTFEVTAEDKWKCKFDKLPSAEVVNGIIKTYEYSVVETTATNLEFAFKEIECKEVEDPETGKTYSKFIVTNMLKTTEIEIDKEWFTYSGERDSLQEKLDSGVYIGIVLSQRSQNMNDVNPKGLYYLGINSITDRSFQPVENASLIADEINSSTGWKYWAAKFTNLPKYYAVDNGDNTVTLEKYVYEIEEDSISIGDYELVMDDVTNENGAVIIEGSKVYAQIGEDGTYSTIRLVNKSNASFRLPETGGRGRSYIPVYIAMAVVIFSTIALLVYRRKLRKN